MSETDETIFNLFLIEFWNDYSITTITIEYEYDYTYYMEYPYFKMLKDCFPNEYYHEIIEQDFNYDTHEWEVSKCLGFNIIED